LAPPWVADYVLIAVSDYLDNGKVGADDDDGGLLSPDFDAVQSDDSAPSTMRSEEAWASWVEHEFGEKPEDPEL